ncbi:MAG TPA: D-glycero-beta-D-manno-heptose-7-phosphate kinase [Vicinamibacterales bacterium]|nr:D-glycero-beta-D-manno-heptose-7-phosphate kinase [Vicinamibacterales bacterium]
MNHAAARQLVSRLSGRPILIVGDVMLDQFLFGHVERISPEAPVPVVRFEREEYRLGGAANVAHNIRALGAQPLLTGVVGADDAAARLAAELARLEISSEGVISSADRITTRKLRVVTRRNQQVSRIDYETDGTIAEEAERAMLEYVERHVSIASVVVISDYLKGVVSRRLAARTIELAAHLDVPVLVDPKVPHVDYYAGATLVTPNHYEAEAVALMRIRTAEDARAAAKAFRDRARCAGVLITRGEHGMWLLDDERDYELPATAREVSDVTGAGDTVIATIASALAADASVPDAAWLANRAAGIVVGKFGAAVVTPEELLAAI